MYFLFILFSGCFCSPFVNDLQLNMNPVHIAHQENRTAFGYGRRVREKNEKTNTHKIDIKCKQLERDNKLINKNHDNNGTNPRFHK